LKILTIFSGNGSYRPKFGSVLASKWGGNRFVLGLAFVYPSLRRFQIANVRQLRVPAAIRDRKIGNPRAARTLMFDDHSRLAPLGTPFREFLNLESWGSWRLAQSGSCGLSDCRSTTSDCESLIARAGSTDRRLCGLRLFHCQLRVDDFSLQVFFNRQSKLGNLGAGTTMRI
jgi:hypothetical protein